MKVAMDKLNKKIKDQKRIIVFLLIIALIGLICGSFFITLLNKTDQELVKTYIETFINNINTNKLNYLDAFKNTLVTNSIYTIVIWLLGISIIGIPIIILMYFTKLFIISFSVSAFILKYQLKGVLLVLTYVFPHHIINFLIYTLLMIYATKFSYILINSIIKKKTIHFKNIMNNYLIILGICIVVLILTSLYETFAVPYILKQVISLVKI